MRDHLGLEQKAIHRRGLTNGGRAASSKEELDLIRRYNEWDFRLYEHARQLYLETS